MTEIPDDIMKAANECVALFRWNSDNRWHLFVARAIQAERERDGWQTIGTAPRDGSVFLAATTRAQRPTACMCKVESGKFLVLSNGEKFEGQGWAQWWPTHWQPLPAAPETEREAME